MTQGAPVVAGTTNDATKTTEIDLTPFPPPFGDVLRTMNGTVQIGGAFIFGLNVMNVPAMLNPLGVVSTTIGPNSDAVYAIGGGRGVYAMGQNGVGVRAYSYTDIGTDSFGYLAGVKGVTGNSTGAGVVGENLAQGPGVIGNTHSSTEAGVFGVNHSAGPGVVGQSKQGIGVTGITNDAKGVAVLAKGGRGVGLEASGDRAAIRLDPRGTRGPPTTGLHSMGEMIVDAVGNLFFCKATGTPGTWVKVA